jgi:hydroxymethylpyrimidine/phosphomethylpyrimidine kinase
MPAYPLPPVVLTFAAADPSGGGGLQADLLTLSSMGCHALSVVTALTVQDTAEVDAVAPVDAEWVADQARLLLEDMTVQAFKVGYAATVENIAAIAEIVSDYPDIPLILDPVLLSARADESNVDELVAALRDLLVPQATVVTTSAADLRRLVQEDADEPEEGTIDDCAARLVQLGAEFVLVTGTHQNTPEVINTLYGAEGVVHQDKWERLPGRFHGAGCTLSAAIAAALANGVEFAEAIRDAQEYTWQTLAAGFRPGMGRVLPDRFFWAREGDDEPAPPDA